MTLRRRYPSDLTERQWTKIEPVLPYDLETGRKRKIELREVVNAICYRWRTGCVWRMLPHDLPPWTTVYTYFRRWQRDGTLVQIRNAVLQREGTPHRSSASSRNPSWPIEHHPGDRSDRADPAGQTTATDAA